MDQCIKLLLDVEHVVVPLVGDDDKYSMLRDDSYRTGTSDTPVCECGLDRESAEHFLLRCNRFQEARNRLTDTIREMSDSSARKKVLCLSEALLLAPKCDDVTSKEAKFIKEALFQYISDTQVKL